MRRRVRNKLTQKHRSWKPFRRVSWTENLNEATFDTRFFSWLSACQDSNRICDDAQDTERGVSTSTQQKQRILQAVDTLAGVCGEQTTVQGAINASWKLIWTTEKASIAKQIRMNDDFTTTARRRRCLPRHIECLR